MMWKKIWQFLQDEKNLSLLTLIGGGLAVVIAGLWAAALVYFPAPGHKSSPTQKQIEAACGSVAIGGDREGSSITAGSSGDCAKAIERIRREKEEAKKEAELIALEAERKRQEEAANKEDERIAFKAERKRQEVAARKEAERLAFEAQKKRQEEAAMKEAERLALEAEKKRQEEAAAKQEAERLALEAEKKRREDAAKNEAERLTLEAEKKHQEEAARKEAERQQEEKRAAEERKIAEEVARAVKKERPPRWKILETGYSFLKNIGGEEEGYGLYSYAILVNDGSRSAKFLSAVFGDAFAAEAGIPEPDKHTPDGIPPIEETAADPYQTNILYITLKRNKADEWSNGLKLGNEAALRAAYAKNYYDYKISRALLDHLCGSPAEEIKEVCEGDLSRGPYIFSYAAPASNVTPVPPPFLLMDLSNVHERAFPEIIAAFRAQVKREDISDRAKIDTLRLKVLNIVLTTADWLVPVRKAVADIVYSASGQTEKDKK